MKLVGGVASYSEKQVNSPKEYTGVDLLACAIMKNHFHLIFWSRHDISGYTPSDDALINERLKLDADYWRL